MAKPVPKPKYGKDKPSGSSKATVEATTNQEAAPVAGQTDEALLNMILNSTRARSDGQTPKAEEDRNEEHMRASLQSRGMTAGWDGGQPPKTEDARNTPGLNIVLEAAGIAPGTPPETAAKDAPPKPTGRQETSATVSRDELVDLIRDIPRAVEDGLKQAAATERAITVAVRGLRQAAAGDPAIAVMGGVVNEIMQRAEDRAQTMPPVSTDPNRPSASPEGDVPGEVPAQKGSTASPNKGKAASTPSPK